MSAVRGVEPVVVGLVRRAHGVRGEVVVEPTTDVAGRFAGGAMLTVIDSENRSRVLEIADVRLHRGLLLVRFVGCEDRDAAEELRGSSIVVSAEEVPVAPEGAYYYYELIGCRCRDGDGSVLGIVADVVEDGGGLLLALEGEGRTLLVPFVNEFVRRIDVEGQVIELELPPGLLESCVSPS